MSGVNKFITDYRIDKLDGLFIDLEQITDSPYQIIQVFNNSKGLMQKYWLKSPRLKLFRDTIPLNRKFKNSIPLSVLLNIEDSEVRRFRNYIKKLERSIIKTINKKKKYLYSVKKIYDDLPEVFNMKMPFEKVENSLQFNFQIYNKSRRVNIDKLMAGNNIAVFVELSNIWISNDKMGFNWNVLQMKVYPKYDFGNYQFSDEEDDEVEISDTVKECYHCMYCPNHHPRTGYYLNNETSSKINSHNYKPPSPPPLAKSSPIITTNSPEISKPQIRPFVLSVQDLLSVKLKPIENKDQNKDKVIESNLTNNITNNMKNIKNNLIDAK